MKKLRNTVIALGVSLSMLVGFAPSAQAYTVYYNKCYNVNYYNTGTYERRCYFDYTWWEEFFKLKHDGYKIVSYGFL